MVIIPQLTRFSDHRAYTHTPTQSCFPRWLRPSIVPFYCSHCVWSWPFWINVHWFCTRRPSKDLWKQRTGDRGLIVPFVISHWSVCSASPHTPQSSFQFLTLALRETNHLHSSPSLAISWRRSEYSRIQMSSCQTAGSTQNHTLLQLNRDILLLSCFAFTCFYCGRYICKAPWALLSWRIPALYIIKY